MNSILAEIEDSIISKVVEAAEESKAINFAENPLELFTPESVIENAKEALEGGLNGYIAGAGRKPLRKLTSELIAKETGVTFDPEKEITITAGASEAFVCSMLSLVEGENGVVIPEPFYENYVP
ncbi:MAG: aminotransferase class I/II-fold pyridoxal phosphate-dependent enzyme, partial [candidate division WOR-3 bacterium]